MKASAVILALSFILVTLLAQPVTSVGAMVTFDDLSETATGVFIPSGYEGLVWSNFAAHNAIAYSADNGLSGYFFGLVSGSNTAFNARGNPAEIDALGTNFSFQSAYLTGAWMSNLNIEIQGFRSGLLVYDTNVVASATNATLFMFECLNIDRLLFTPSGGEYAGFGSSGENFVVDNFEFEFVPEPSSLLLCAGGAVSLCLLLRRRRSAPGSTTSV